MNEITSSRPSYARFSAIVMTVFGVGVFSAAVPLSYAGPGDVMLPGTGGAAPPPTTAQRVDGALDAAHNFGAPARNWLDSNASNLIDPSKRSDPTAVAQVGVSAAFGTATSVYSQGGSLMVNAGVNPGSIPTGAPPPRSMVNQLWRHMEGQQHTDARGMTRNTYPNASRADARGRIGQVRGRAGVLQRAGNALQGAALAGDMTYRAAQGDYSGATVHGFSTYGRIKAAGAAGAYVGGWASAAFTPWVGIPAGIIAGAFAGWTFDQVQARTIGTPDEIADRVTVYLADDPSNGLHDRMNELLVPPDKLPVPASERTPAPPDNSTMGVPSENTIIAGNSEDPLTGRPPGYPESLPWPPEPKGDETGAGADDPPTVAGNDPPDGGSEPGEPPFIGPMPEGEGTGDTDTPTIAATDGPDGGAAPQPGDPDFIGPLNQDLAEGSDGGEPDFISPLLPTDGGEAPREGEPGFVGPVMPADETTTTARVTTADSGTGGKGGKDAPSEVKPPSKPPSKPPTSSGSDAAANAARETARTTARTTAQNAARSAARPTPPKPPRITIPRPPPPKPPRIRRP